VRDGVQRVQRLMVIRPQAGDQHDHTPVFELLDRILEHQRTGRVDRAHGRHPQDDDRHVRHLRQLEEEAMGGEQQRAIDAVGDDVLVEQCSLLDSVVTR
jgi:hypothetical protein